MQNILVKAGIGIKFLSPYSGRIQSCKNLTVATIVIGPIAA